MSTSTRERILNLIFEIPYTEVNHTHIADTLHSGGILKYGVGNEDSYNGLLQLVKLYSEDKYIPLATAIASSGFYYATRVELKRRLDFCLYQGGFYYYDIPEIELEPVYHHYYSVRSYSEFALMTDEELIKKILAPRLNVSKPGADSYSLIDSIYTFVREVQSYGFGVESEHYEESTVALTNLCAYKNGDLAAVGELMLQNEKFSRKHTPLGRASLTAHKVVNEVKHKWTRQRTTAATDLIPNATIVGGVVREQYIRTHIQGEDTMPEYWYEDNIKDRLEQVR